MFFKKLMLIGILVCTPLVQAGPTAFVKRNSAAVFLTTTGLIGCLLTRRAYPDAVFKQSHMPVRQTLRSQREQQLQRAATLRYVASVLALCFGLYKLVR